MALKLELFLKTHYFKILIIKALPKHIGFI